MKIDISNCFRLMENFVDMIYIVTSFHPTIGYLIHIYGKELSSVSFTSPISNYKSFCLFHTY